MIQLNIRAVTGNDGLILTFVNPTKSWRGVAYQKNKNIRFAEFVYVLGRLALS